MTTGHVLDPIPGSRLKLEWAKHHLNELRWRVAGYIDTHPYQVWDVDDPASGEKRYSVTFTTEPPDELGLVAGDCVHNLRSSLDQLISGFLAATALQTNGPSFRSLTCLRVGRRPRGTSLAWIKRSLIWSRSYSHTTFPIPATASCTF